MPDRALDTAVLLLAFNRPETTRRVFEAIRVARPPRLYVAVDGPRPSHPQDLSRCEQVRQIVTAVDWPCTQLTLFRHENLGCKRSVSGALDWFFSQEAQGIVLEDDCVPSGSFFAFCQELLERYRQDPHVFAIQGTFFGSRVQPRSSYLFSKVFHMWGWASWADRWRKVRIDEIDIAGVRRALEDNHWLGHSTWERDYWLDLCMLQSRGEIDSWGYPVLFHCLANGLLNVTPSTNLVVNVGTGGAATRTQSMDCGPWHRDALEIAFPLVEGKRYAGAEDLLPFEYRWRIHLSRWKLLKHVLRFRYPWLFDAVRPRSREVKR